jgi:hypothetical protein
MPYTINAMKQAIEEIAFVRYTIELRNTDLLTLSFEVPDIEVLSSISRTNENEQLSTSSNELHLSHYIILYYTKPYTIVIAFF